MYMRRRRNWKKVDFNHIFFFVKQSDICDDIKQFFVFFFQLNALTVNSREIV